jgi:hypothetical protein
MRNLKCVFGTLMLTLALHAQTAVATLSGTVRGPLGTVVPHARISAKNIATGQTTETEADTAGTYSVPNLPQGEYEVTVSATGFSGKLEKVTIAGGAKPTLDLALTAASGNAAAPSLGDLGYTPEQAQGNALAQARLDKRSHMLKIHQRLGLITTAPLLASIIASSGAAGRHSTGTGRDIHAGLGALTAGLYFTAASFAIFAPRIEGTKTRGPIRLHKALAWIHGPGMILTPLLGAMAFDQRSRGEKVHGIAQAHSAVAWVTAGAYVSALLSVTIKF